MGKGEGRGGGGGANRTAKLCSKMINDCVRTLKFPNALKWFGMSRDAKCHIGIQQKSLIYLTILENGRAEMGRRRSESPNLGHV